MTWRARDSDEHTPIIRRAPLHYQCPKPKCSCSLRATASPRASTAWPATCPRLSPNLPSASWTTSLWPQWLAALAKIPRPTSQPPPRAVPSLQCAMEASFLERRRQHRPSTSALWRRSSGSSAK